MTQNLTLQLRLLKEENRILSEENYSLKQRVKELSAIVTDESLTLPFEWGFTQSERNFLILLYKNKSMTAEKFVLLNPNSFRDTMSGRSGNTLISRIRKKLTELALPVTIHSNQNGGYYLDESSKDYISRVLED